jgi:hypothetical protein
VLGIEVLPLSNHGEPPAEGAFQAVFPGRLVNSGGREYWGVPVIGVALQQFENGNLAGDDGVQQRANYGTATPMTRSQR